MRGELGNSSDRHARASARGEFPYQDGLADRRAGKSGPPFPKGDASWAERLYNRGWLDG